MLTYYRVVESVTSAHRFELNSRATMKLAHSSAAMINRPSAARDVVVIVNVTKRANWWVTLSKGSWTRVITNLVGKLRHRLQLPFNTSKGGKTL